MLLAGCAQEKQAPTACYKLEMCKGFMTNAGEVNIFCVFGYDAAGNKNGVVEKFLTQDAIAAWAQFHPEAKGCDK
jgi:hypothetical protein